MRLITKKYTLDLQPSESTPNQQAVTNRYPALSIDLAPMQITASCSGHQIAQPTKHQLKAIAIATQLLNFKLSQIMSVCAIRPALLSSDFVDGERQARKWQSEHELNTEDLADLYIQKWQELIVSKLSIN
jgi:hypothetical protein